MFWLSSVFWAEAYTQRNAAAQLQVSTQPELTLFQLAFSLDQERVLVDSTLLGNRGKSDKLEALGNMSDKSVRLLRKAFDEIKHSRSIESKYIEHRYSDQAIESLMLNLSDGFSRISQTTSIVHAQTSLPLPDRDEGVRMQLFDFYSQLIQEVNNLRHRTHFIPVKNYQNVVAAHELKNALWNLSESINQNRTLLDGYLVKTANDTGDKLNKDGIRFRAYQQIQRAEQSMSEFAEFFESNSADSELRAQVQTLQGWYVEEYKPYEESLLVSLRNDLHPIQTAEQFRKVSDTFQKKIHALSDQTINQTLSTAESINKTAANRLVIDTLLVLVCVGMAVASMRISRKVQYQASHDELTQLPNRRYFSHQLKKSLSKIEDNIAKLVLVTIDLDRFKAINDTMGHAVGDALLMQVAQRLNDNCDQRMTIARMGGDEFAILFITDDPNEGDQLAGKIRQALSKAYVIDGSSVNVGASFGISQFPDDAKTTEELQISSDFAMFHAKQDSENKIHHFNREMAERFDNRNHIERDLSQAIAEGQLELYYQPQFNLKQNRVDAVEALIRWNHPVKGFIVPADFVEIAEESGLMPAMGKWVLDEACRQVAVWNNQEDLNLRVAVNVSVHQIMQQDFVEQVFAALEQNSIKPCCLDLEITESVVMADVDWVVESLLVLKNAGIRIALDDFGTGYSSLSQLQTLPLNVLKIDRSFISKLERPSEVSHSFTATITKLAETLGLETIAEGVESDNQRLQVSALGIDVIQGYYYSKPVVGREIASVVKNIDADANSNPVVKAA